MTVNDKIISTKLGLLNLAEELGNVSKACRVMGFSRDSFYRYKEARDTGGVESLLDANRRVPNRKNRVDERTESAAVALAIDNPALGRCGSAMNCARPVCSFHPAVSAASGYATVLKP